MTSEDRNRAEIEDELLAIRCQLGEPLAFDELVARWHAPLWRYLRRLAAADDVAAETLQEVWLRVVRGISRLREPARLRAWLFGIARRAAMDRLRQQYAAPPLVEAELADLPAGEEIADAGEDVTVLLRELDLLPVVEREALTLFYLRELSLAEIAGVLAIPVGTVKSRLFRARRLLREQIQSKENP